MDFLMIVAHICSHAPPLHWMTEPRKRRKRLREREQGTESLSNRQGGDDISENVKISRSNMNAT